MNALADRELVELLRERPDLLAVADAVAATQAPTAMPVARRRLPPISVVPAVAAAAAVVVLLLLAAPWRNDGSTVSERTIFERALAVVGTYPVIHVVFQYSSHESVVTLATGAERPRVHRNEVWYDEDRGLMRVRLSTDGSRPEDSRDYLQDQPWATPGPGIDGFATHYRDALEQGGARIVGDTNVDGRPAKLIEFTPPSKGAAVEQVAVNAETFVPLTVTFTSHERRSSTLLRVLEIQSLPYRRALFAPGKAVARNPPSAVVDGGSEVSAAEAARVLGRTPLGLEEAADSVRLERATASSGDGRKVHGVVIELTYGDVSISEARDEAGVRALGVDRSSNPAPPEGAVAVFEGAGRSFGWLRRSGLTVWLRAPTKDDLLAAARALAPLR